MNGLIQKYKTLVLTLVAIGLVLGALTPLVIKPRYKSVAVVSISPRYFQHPFVRDFMTELYDTTELRSQRESLIRQAFNDSFLDDASQKLGLVKDGESELEAARRRQDLSRSIEVVPLQATEYQVSFISQQRENAVTILKDGLANLARVMRDERGKVLVGLRDAVAQQVAQLNGQTSDGPVGTASSDEVARLESELKNLESLYTDRHPRIREIKSRLAFISAAKETDGEAKSATASLLPTRSAPITGEARATTYTDLARKLSYLEIALRVEATQNPAYLTVVKAPNLPLTSLGPSRMMFMLWGALAGFFLSVMFVVLRESSVAAGVATGVSTTRASTPPSPSTSRSSRKAPAFGQGIKGDFIEDEGVSKRVIENEPPGL